MTRTTATTAMATILSSECACCRDWPLDFPYLSFTATGRRVSSKSGFCRILIYGPWSLNGGHGIDESERFYKHASVAQVSFPRLFSGHSRHQLRFLKWYATIHSISGVAWCA